MANQIDINEEYEKIFGVETHETLFSADDEEYLSLRQAILGAPREFYNKKKLPFEGVELHSYEEFLRKGIILEAEKKGYRIFYIKRYSGSNLSIYAAGYFNPQDSRFYVLADSYFTKSAYFFTLSSKMPLFLKAAFLSNYSVEDGVITQKKLYSFTSASLAASFILGKKSSFKEWIDDRDKTLDAYYIMYKASNISESEDKSFPDYVPPAPVAPAPKIDESDPKVFCIKIKSKCNVKGYYDESKNRFVLLKGGVFGSDVDADFDATPLGESRRRFIDACCILNYEMNYEIEGDAECKSATAAASYVLGKEAHYSVWRNTEGKYLKDFYPDRFVLTEAPKPSEKKSTDPIGSTIRLYYIKKDAEQDRFCDASGYYDPVAQKFILKAGSILSTNATLTYNNSQQGFMRRYFLNKYCSKEPRGYRLREDHVFDSPTGAASYVVGRTANGWLEWKDKQNQSLSVLYRQ